MNATATATATAAILYSVFDDVARAFRVTPPDSLRSADDDALSDWGNALDETGGVDAHAAGEIRAALLDYRIVADDSGRENCPDVLAHRAELLQQHAAGAAALLALQDATGEAPDADDVGMIRSASASALEAWADDLADRCGLDVAAFRDALRPLQAAAFARDCETARKVCADVLTAAQRKAWRVDDADPRGETDGGADMYREGDARGRIVGLYLAPAHLGGGWYVYDGRNDGELACSTAGGGLDVDAARVALRACLAAVDADCNA